MSNGAHILCGTHRVARDSSRAAVPRGERRWAARDARALPAPCMLTRRAARGLTTRNVGAGAGPLLLGSQMAPR